MHKSLQGKSVLVTAGPTWVPLDRVRVIANISTGATGIAIAQRAARDGARVTLLLGPIPDQGTGYRVQGTGVKVIRFTFFDELKKIVTSELKRKKYDILIHAAAVSDYRPARTVRGKVSSGKKELTIELEPTEKIVDRMRALAPRSYLVMFKLEAEKAKRRLIEIAYESMVRAGANMIVANDALHVGRTRHRAFIIDRHKRIVQVETKKALAIKLCNAIGGAV